MSTVLKKAVQMVKIDGAMQQVLAITDYNSVAKELNGDGTVKVSLAQELTEFASALAEKAKSTDVTQEIQTACNDLYNKLLGRASDDVTIDEAYDTLKEIADWITGHGEAAATLTNDVATLKTNVQTLTEQIAALKNTEVTESSQNGYINVDGADVKVYENPGANVFVANTAEEAAAAEAKMQEGDVLLRVV